MKFAGKFTVEAKSKGIKKNVTMLITKREDVKPLLGKDWLRRFTWAIRNIKTTTTTTEQSEKDKIVKNFQEFSKTNRTIKDTKIWSNWSEDIHRGHPPVKQKAIPLQYHSQSFFEKNKQKKSIRTLRENTKCRAGLFRIYDRSNREERSISKTRIGVKKNER